METLFLELRELYVTEHLLSLKLQGLKMERIAFVGSSVYASKLEIIDEKISKVKLTIVSIAFKIELQKRSVVDAVCSAINSDVAFTQL